MTRMNLHRRRQPHLSVALAAALACALPAHAGDYFWSYGTGCAQRDFTSTCWSAAAGGAGGLSVPLSGLNTAVIRQAGAVDLLVNFANAGTGRDHTFSQVQVDGSGTGFGTLGIARNKLTAEVVTVGWQGRGRLVMTGGELLVTSQLAVGGFSGTSGVLDLQGGTTTSALSYVGSYDGATGVATVSGPATTWTTQRELFVGFAAQGTLNLNEGATVRAGNAFVGYLAGSTGNAVLSGPQSLLDAGNLVVIGNAGRGSLTMSGGAQLRSATGLVGATTGGQGLAELSGAGTAWVNSGILTIGDFIPQTSFTDGRGELRINTGARVEARSVDIKVGTLHLNGGTLRTASIDRASNGGNFIWTSGTLSIAGDATLGSGGFDSVLALTPGRTLAANGALRLPAGTALSLAGGSLQTGSGVALTGGTLSGSPATSLLNVPVSGHGVVAGAVRGPGASVSVEGGNLTLGSIAQAGTVSLGTTTVAPGRTLLLLDGGVAQLGSVTTLYHQARLASVNGIALGVGQQLVLAERAEVAGAFQNDGTVRGGDGLTFSGPVTGAGSFTGAVSFLQRYSVGGDGGVAQVDFGRGAVSFAAGSTLALDLLGPGGNDRLLGIDRLDFQGRLDLRFAFVPVEGTRLSLLDFSRLSGGLAADRVDVSGFDRNRLDFSRLAIDGTVGVTAVPEPGTWALWLTGLAALAGLTRRKRLNG